MLDTAGKLFEKLLKKRLTLAIQEAGNLHKKHHGFRKGRSTIGAISNVVETALETHRGNNFSRPLVLLCLLDIKNAFNSLRWSDVISTLEHKFRIPEYLLSTIKSYLRDRYLLYKTETGLKTMQLTAGAAQGSILGPDLWNITYDDILRLNLPENCQLIGYADDIAITIMARNTAEAQRKLTSSMILIKSWLDSHGLQLATQKTEILFFTRKQMAIEIPLRIDDVVIHTKKTVKYLGIRLDPKLTYWNQLNYATSKAAEITASLSKLMANTRGPVASKRKLLMMMTVQILLYGSEIWADTLKAKCRTKPLLAVQRTAALRVISAYRTVAGSAALVIAGTIPVNLLAEERKRAYKIKVEERYTKEEATRLREDTLIKWQHQWETDTKARWTARLIPQIKRWQQRKYGEVNHYLTQMLTGHGYFYKYLHKIGKSATPRCSYGDSDEDSTEHTEFHCVRWESYRHEIEEDIGPITPDSVINTMLKSEHNWNRVALYIEKILRLKKYDIDTISAD